MSDLNRLLEIAIRNHQAGNLAEAERGYWAVLALVSDQFDALHFLGIAQAQRGLHSEAMKFFKRALVINPRSAEANANLGNALMEMHQPAQALTSFIASLNLQPANIQTLLSRGNALRALKRWNEALASYDEALAINDRFVPALNNKGALLRDLHRYPEALASFKRALELEPNHVGILVNLGSVSRAIMRSEDALRLFERALALDPTYAEALNSHGNALVDLHRYSEALSSFQRALALKPGYAEALNGYGNSLANLNRLEEAVESYREAIAINPDYAEAHCGLGGARQRLGNREEAIADLHRAIQLKPDLADAHSSLIFSMQYLPLASSSQSLPECRRFAEKFEAPARLQWPQHHNKREPTRRLKVGYVSPDFRSHAVATFIAPIIEKHDKNQFEIFCYYNHKANDEQTQRIANSADHWLNCSDMDDQYLADAIHMDGIDILVDLAGHTAHNRMLTFARKPAPIQITYLGYPGTTGLSAMDYRLTDHYADPAGSEVNYTEQLLRLPNSLWCYRPRKDMPENTALPAEQNGYVTFGSFNSVNKIDGQCINLWARVLQAVPNSRLLIVTAPEGEPRRRLTEQFTARGVAAERLDFHGTLTANEFHRTLQRVDITLDPITVNGATTTCESLWLGAPVISLVGARFLERAGFSILSASGLHDFVAATPQEYINIAARLAENLPQLADTRRQLRSKVAASPLVDEVKFTRNLENIYREAWTKWCGTVT